MTYFTNPPAAHHSGYSEPLFTKFWHSCVGTSFTHYFSTNIQIFYLQSVTSVYKWVFIGSVFGDIMSYVYLDEEIGHPWRRRRRGTEAKGRLLMDACGGGGGAVLKFVIEP